MRVFSHLLAALLLLLIFQACTERTICPAYQSAFIHDKEALKRQFSYFGEDSMPKVFEASKDRFLIIEPVSYHRKLRSLETIAMTDIYPEVEDSTEVDDDEFYLAERDVIDSASMQSDPADSVYVISLKKEKFNIDQELYLWYLKEYLVYPDIRLMREQEARAAEAENAEEKKPGFFKRLFGGKKKDGEETEFDVETNATDIDEEQSGEKQKKGFFNFLKKKNPDDQELEDPDKESGEKESTEEEEKSTAPDALK
ncbi:MAG: hypothetical protein P8X57_12370 [Cyclobacteriaceae bacterium]